MVDDVDQIVLQTFFACLQCDSLPVFLLLLFAPLLGGRKGGHVMLFEQGFSLVPGAAARVVEQTLPEQIGSDVVFEFMLLAASNHIHRLVHDAGVNPSWRQTPEIGPLPAVVHTILFALFFFHKDFPSRVDLLENVYYLLVVGFGWSPMMVVNDFSVHSVER